MHYAAYSIEFNRIENLGILIEKKSELEVAAESFTDLQPQAVMHWTNPLQTVAMVWHTRESSIFNAIPHRSMLFCRICFMATPAAATPAVGLSAFDGPITLATKNLRPPRTGAPLFPFLLTERIYLEPALVPDWHRIRRSDGSTSAVNTKPASRGLACYSLRPPDDPPKVTFGTARLNDLPLCCKRGNHLSLFDDRNAPMAVNIN